MSVLPIRAIVHAAVAASAALSGAHGITSATAATRYELTFRVIDRTGHAVKPLDLQVMRISTGTNVDVGQGTSTRVTAGRYNIAVWIPTGTGPQSFTLADQVVRVTRGRTITFDARRGKRVRIGLDATNAVDEVIELAPIVNGFWAFNPTFVFDSVDGGTMAAPAFVVPMTSPLVTLYEYSVWEKRGNTAARPSPFRYDIIKVYRGGFPSNPAISVHTRDLARVWVSVRATDPGQQATLELSPMNPTASPLPLNAGTDLGATPAGVASYRTPGYNWQPIVDLSSSSGEMRDDVLNMAVYGRGRFTERYFSAVLSPPLLNGPSVSVENRALQASTWPLIGDPANPDSTDEVTRMSGHLRLYSGGRLLASSSLGTFGGTLNAQIPMARHWYSLHADATRTAGAWLSTRIHGVWVFPAHGTTNFNSFAAALSAVRLLAGGLDLRNRAGSGTLTPVTMQVHSNSDPPARFTVVRAYMSADDGKTWHAVGVRARSGHYVFNVRDPKSAGFVSLRVSVRDSAGDSESLTIIHAYGVR
jgi:hypothetical protein